MVRPRTCVVTSFAAEVHLNSVFDGLFHDAAIFPPGNAPMDHAVQQHHEYLQGAFCPWVGPIVCSLGRRPEFIAAAQGGAPIDLTVVVPADVEDIAKSLPRADTDVYRLRGVEATVPWADATRLDRLVDYRDSSPSPLDVYIELESWPTASEDLIPIAERGFGLKLRTGGVVATAFPSERALARAITSAISAGTRFKCTAGLHSAVRHRDAPTGFDHHGFLNVLLATDAALESLDVSLVEATLAERDGATLAAGLRAVGPDRCARARESFRSFGTCSIDEPIGDLIDLGLVCAS
jgi:hypothetical protein